MSFEDAQAAFGGVVAGLPAAFQQLPGAEVASALGEGDGGLAPKGGHRSLCGEQHPIDGLLFVVDRAEVA
ncbi:hypothetical protein, partial [Streptosporangium canum]|uniref:hypothetical protein n=1 Tax=Streptosporangium canum TaxID=324952 RepID=UPI00379B4591